MRYLLCVTFSLLVLTSCRQNKDPLVLQDSMIKSLQGSFPYSRNYSGEVVSFYKQRNYSFAWLDKNGLNDYGKRMYEKFYNETGDTLEVANKNVLARLHDAVDKRRFKAE